MITKSSGIFLEPFVVKEQPRSTIKKGEGKKLCINTYTKGEAYVLGCLSVV